MTAYKLFTHDRRPPVQGGETVWDGSYPFTLPQVSVDTSDAECGAGWNYVTDLAAGMRIAGLWPNGRPALITVVEPGADAVERGDKWRASTITIVRAATEEEIRAGIDALSEPFGKHQEEMAREQWEWYLALGRPGNDPGRVGLGLQEALAVRGLGWSLRQFENAWAAWAARDAWAAWAAWAARDAWAAWAARDALTVRYASRMGWVSHEADLLTTGIRDAYRAGLGIVLPTGPDELGWVMAEVA